jgi:hypothetical protein
MAQIEKEQTELPENKDTIIQPMDNGATPVTTSMKKMIVLVYIVLGVMGIGTGFLLSRTIKTSNLTTGSSPKNIKTDTVVGSTDEKTFKDSAVGKIEKGGIDGEGTHQLVRDGGPSQTVYLLSSVVDLDEYVGKTVKVWGQTQAAKKAAWLMDVGKIELQTTE